MNKLFRDIRTGEVKAQFSIREIKYMREINSSDIINNTENEIKKLVLKEKIFRKKKGFDL